MRRPLVLLLCASILLLPMASQLIGAKSSPTASITVRIPNGGEEWPKNSNCTISWTSQGMNGKVKLILIKGATVFGDIVRDCPANGSYKWTVGDCPASGLSADPARDYRIRVVSNNDPAIRDDSNTTFNITAPKAAQ